MRDFSLLYGPARTWAAVIGTAIVAVAIGFFVQGSANAQESGQQISTEGVANRSSSPGAEQAASQSEGDENDADESDSTDLWLNAPQSAGDIPFVSLRPSPEPITEAGEELVSSNATTTVPTAPSGAATPVDSSNDGDSSDDGDSSEDDGPTEDVVNTSTTPADSDEDDAETPYCDGRGGSKDAAIADYRDNCTGKRKDCDPQPNGRWICANRVLEDTVADG